MGAWKSEKFSNEDELVIFLNIKAINPVDCKIIEFNGKIVLIYYEEYNNTVEVDIDSL